MRGGLRLLLKTLLQFVAAGALYYPAEVLFRLCRHHEPPKPQVFLLGGFACLMLAAICRIPLRGKARWLVLPLLGGIVLTTFELVLGLYLLTIKGTRLWNYGGCFANYRTVICLKFSLLWVAVTAGFLFVDRFVEHLLRNTRFAYCNMFKKEKAEP